jgi:hypothetical protein
MFNYHQEQSRNSSFIELPFPILLDLIRSNALFENNHYDLIDSKEKFPSMFFFSDQTFSSIRFVDVSLSKSMFFFRITFNLWSLLEWLLMIKVNLS